MTDQENSASIESPDKVMRPGKVRLDAKLLGQALFDLNIARKHCSIYPPGHVVLARSVDRAHQVLKKLLEPLPRLTLGVAKDRLFIGGKYLDRKNIVHRDLALAFHARDVAAITFHDWLTRDDVLGLCRILATDALEIREAGGLREVMKNELLMGIDLRAIDYSRLRFTDEEEVFAEGAGDDQKSGDQIWRSFVTHLLSGCLDSDGNPVSPDDQQSEDPRTIAKLLNSNQLGRQGAIAGYEKTLGRFLCETTGTEPLEKLMDLLRNLTPELRGQFLSATFEQVAGSGREGLFGCFPDDIVLEMLKQANNEAREISPSLMSLLERVSRIETEAHPPGVEEKGGALKDGLEACLSIDQAQTLFERESYETFVDSEYQDLLKELVTSSSSSKQVGEGPRNRQTPEAGSIKGQTGVEVEVGSVSNEYVAAMEDRHVDLRLGHMLAAMLRQCVEVDEYRCFSRQVTAGMPEFLAYGDFELCLDILRTFRTHADEKDGLFREIAGESLLTFGSEDIVNASVEALDRCPPDKTEQAVSFVSQLGTLCIPKVLDLFAQEEYPSRKKALFDLLTAVGGPVLEEACARIQGAPVNVIRNLLLLVQRTGGQDTVPQIRSLMTHENVLVRMDAMVTLLELKDPDASLYLRGALGSANGEESSRAISLAGFYRISDVVDDLVGLIKPFPLFRAGYGRNVEVVRSLGRIGDDRAIPTLEKLARKRLTLYPQHRGRMLHALFESLAGYPPESLGALLMVGAKSRDGRIRMLTEKYARQVPGGSLRKTR